jgi:hypothetical protein
MDADDTPSEWLHEMLAEVDPGNFYVRFFNMGFFTSNNRILTGSVPSRVLTTLLKTLEMCDDVVDDPRFPCDVISRIFGWKHTLQSVVQTYLRTNGHYTSIEETFLDQPVSTTGARVRDMFEAYPVFGETIVDRTIDGQRVRLMHLLWILRGLTYRCDESIREYCIQQQIQTAHERMDVRNLFEPPSSPSE